jgi:hypothetical protein
MVGARPAEVSVIGPEAVDHRRDPTGEPPILQRDRVSDAKTRPSHQQRESAERVAPQSWEGMAHSSASAEIHSSLRKSSGVSPASRTIPAIV